MDFERILLIIIGVVAYAHLLKVAQNRSISGLVNIYIESRERDSEVHIPDKYEVLTKSCPFFVTPVPGMEYSPCGIEGIEIKRVVTDDSGLLEVICLLVVSSKEGEFQETCEMLEQDGWRNKHVGWE